MMDLREEVARIIRNGRACMDGNDTIADAVLSALSDRSRSEVGGVKTAADAPIHWQRPCEAAAWSEGWNDAERRVRKRLVAWLRAWAATRQLGLTAKAKDICAQAILACAARIEREENHVD